MDALTFLKSFKYQDTELKNFLTANMDETMLASIEYNAKQELTDKLFQRLCVDFGAPDYDKVEKYLKETLIPKSINVYDIYNINNYDNIISEVVHEVAGYLGKNLDDKDFEILHEWVDAHMLFSDYYTLINNKLSEVELNNYPVRNYVERFCKDRKFDVDYVCGVATATSLHEIDIESDKKYVYAVITTALYDMMGTTIVECNCPDALSDYAFNSAEIAQIKELEVGDSLNSEDYGKEIVVVRIK